MKSLLQMPDSTQLQKLLQEEKAGSPKQNFLQRLLQILLRQDCRSFLLKSMREKELKLQEPLP